MLSKLHIVSQSMFTLYKVKMQNNYKYACSYLNVYLKDCWKNYILFKSLTRNNDS